MRRHASFARVLAPAALALALASGCFWRRRPAPPPTTLEVEPVEAVATRVERGAGVYHTIRRGETFYRLSRTYGVSIEEIQEANPGVNPRRLVIGREVFIPGAAGGGGGGGGKAGPLPAREGGFWRPVRGRVLVPFHRRTEHGRSLGVELAAREGEAVLASEAGRVVVAAEGLFSLGRTVVLEHEGGLSTLYGRLGSIRVKPGQAVARGEVLGTAAGGRVHFRLYRGPTPIEPREHVGLR